MTGVCDGTGGGGTIDMGKLTRRQQATLKLLSEGMTPRHIAERLSISRRTVYAHLKEAQYRTGCDTLLELAVKAARVEGAKGE